MKTNIALVVSFVFIGTMVACNSSSKKEDNVKDQNNDRIEATATSDSAEDAQKKDAEFMAEAASGGMMEVEMGKLAASKAVSSQVKAFAEMMVKDHTKANDELISLAAQKNIILPGALMEKHQKMINEVSKKSGRDFDKEYMEHMVEDHNEDIEDFEDAAKECEDADVKAFAAKTIPTLKAHLAQAERTEKMVNKN